MQINKKITQAKVIPYCKVQVTTYNLIKLPIFKNRFLFFISYYFFFFEYLWILFLGTNSLALVYRGISLGIGFYKYL
ncbi:hypothetical protein ACJOMK_02620, partial [Mycoplasmopsis synoviae]